MLRLLAATVVFALAACGGDDDGSTLDASGDGAGTGDAGIDAPAAGNALGRACTGTGQGDCPAGHECVTLGGGTGSWCSKPCADFQDPSCADFYTGPGFPICVTGVRPNPAAEPGNYCQIVCEDLPGDPMICLPGECTGVCPGSLACSAELRNPQGQTVARSCW